MQPLSYALSSTASPEDFLLSNTHILVKNWAGMSSPLEESECLMRKVNSTIRLLTALLNVDIASHWVTCKKADLPTIAVWIYSTHLGLKNSSRKRRTNQNEQSLCNRKENKTFDDTYSYNGIDKIDIKNIGMNVRSKNDDGTFTIIDFT